MGSRCYTLKVQRFRRNTESQVGRCYSTTAKALKRDLSWLGTEEDGSQVERKIDPTRSARARLLDFNEAKSGFLGQNTGAYIQRRPKA